MIPHSATTVSERERAAVDRVLVSGRLSQGLEVAAFEEECAALVGRCHAVAVSSGTAALHLALEALGVAQGALVALPSYACAALLTAVDLHGGRPTLCDVRSDYNVDLDTFPAKAKAAIVPHLFGKTAPLPASMPVIEDIAQSIGGPTGRGSVAAVASFYATKLMTTGEGGMVLTDDAGLAETVRDRRDYDNRDDFARRYPYKMTDMQAALGRVQLERLHGFVERRRAIAARYRERLRHLPLVLPDGEEHVCFRFVVATPKREELQAHLARQGIEAKRPVYRPAHHYLGGDYPMSQWAHEEALSLPIYPGLVEDDADRVIESVTVFFET